MALPTPHYYQIKHSPGVVAYILVNDVPFYRRMADLNITPAGPFNHMMVKGENTVTLMLAEPNADPYRIRTFELNIMREEDDKVVYHARWPDLREDLPEGKRDLPIQHEGKFVFDEETPAPIWQTAPRESFPSEGTRELHEAVLELHGAYARADIDGFLKAMEHKTAEFQKFYGPMSELAPDTARATFGKTLAEPWDLAPYEPAEVVFESRAQGRAAYATRHDGKPLLMARHKLDPTSTWEGNLLLSRIDGRWRIIW